MREFLIESVLPVLEVCGLVFGLTLAFFDVPEDVPERPPKAERSFSAPPADSAIAPRSHLLPPSSERKQEMNDVVARAMRQLESTRSGGPAEPSDPAPPRSTVATRAGSDPGVFGAVSALGEAVKAVHAARTEEDLVRAEERMRGVREQMEASCAAGGGPLCEGAAQIRSLGF